MWTEKEKQSEKKTSTVENKVKTNGQREKKATTTNKNVC